MRIPDCPNKPTIKISGQHEYNIKLITPMFGGGVSTRVNDLSFPIRPTSIRGQLQFWWRATVGAQYATSTELRAAQSAVWGDTNQASRVQVRVELKGKPSDTKVCAVIRPNHNNQLAVFWESPFKDTALPYALFPFQGKLHNNEGPQVDPASCIHDAEFQLTVICHKDIDFKTKVEPALWAWVNFGGLGSRTRRGCGAIYCQEFAPNNPNSIDKWYRDRVPAISYDIREWPTMPTQFLYNNQTGKPIDQWNRVIALLRDFRQKPGTEPGHARPPGPDRSWFSEPDTIRRITQRHSQGHDPAQHHSGGRPLPNGFPRAELGLPIVFKFINDNNGEPRRTTLQPYVGNEIKERMASPLILRPLMLKDNLAVGIILPLQTQEVGQVALVNENNADLTPRHDIPIREPAFAKYPNSPLHGLTVKGSALEAFLNLASQTAHTNTAHKNTGYRKVSL